MSIPEPYYLLINPQVYRPYLPGLIAKLDHLLDNRVTYFKEIHRESRFAICHYTIDYKEGRYELAYDPAKSRWATTDKKTNTPPDLLNCEEVVTILQQFLADIGDPSLKRVEVKLIQTEVFPFKFDPHRDSQFSRLRRIKYLATVLLSCSGLDGGNMQLFHSQNDRSGPFTVIEELPCEAGIGYIVDEIPQIVFHGMKAAAKIEEGAHRAALLLRFFEK
jgi:hypothetical protein